MDLKAQIELAEDLVAKGVISQDQLAVAKITQKNQGTDLTDILVKRGYLSEETLIEAISRKASVQPISLSSYHPSDELIEALPTLFINRAKAIPFSLENDVLLVATANPFDSKMVEEAKRKTDFNVRFVFAPKEDIEEAIKRHFSEDAVEARRQKKEHKENAAREELAQNEQDSEAPLEEAEPKPEAPAKPKPEAREAKENVDELVSDEELEEQKKQKAMEHKDAQEAIAHGRMEKAKELKNLASGKTSEDDSGPDTVKLVEKILTQAVQERASDLHIEPRREKLFIRVRVDGSLEKLTSLPLSVHNKILSRIKILGKLDVAENRRPQDGGCNLKLGDVEVDLRIATYPTILGEAAAIRISSRASLITLEAMGLSEHDQGVFQSLIKRPNGIILVTGPTGSGKTTSLYAALHKIDREAKHVLTAEDPSEREIEGVVQTQINPKAGVTFPVILRSMLREDPDVIMVGEIRDQETAEISLRAAMTGHLVLSTLHTNSAIGAISRLADLGIDTYLIASTLAGVMAQRLVKKICQECKVQTPIAAELLRYLGPKADTITAYTPKGCAKCHQRGFVGRLGIFELVPIDDEFRILINNQSPEVRMQEKATTMGCNSMLEDGIIKINAGLTTVEEVLNVCRRF